METCLVLNGYELVAKIDDQERVMLDLAVSRLTREECTAWVGEHASPLE